MNTKKINSGPILGVALLLLAGCVQTTPPSDVVHETAKGIRGMEIIGEEEYITLLPGQLKYRARIDSGATTCSMSALNIERFERDGKKWVRFQVPLPPVTKDNKLKLSDPMEYPLTRDVKIKQHSGDSNDRPSVKLNVKLGRYEGLTEFTLTDRTTYEYPVLVGRNLLEGHAVVDVSKSYIAEEK